MRKRPRQQRSKQMVDRILDATSRSLAAHGIEGTTTRRVAEMADISVGSLYQYFSDKESVVTALENRMVDHILAMLTELAPRLHSAPLPEAVRAVLEAFCELLDNDDGAYLELIRNWHRVDFSDNLKRLESVIYQLVGIRAGFRHQGEEGALTPRVIYISVNAAVFSLIRYLSEPSPHFSREALIDGLVLMVESMLNAESTRRRKTA